MNSKFTPPSLDVLSGLIGKKFNRVTVLSFDSKTKNYLTVWNCVCECGKFFKTRAVRLKGGTCRSCGCLAREISSKVHKTHGESVGENRSGTVEYICWRGIIQRTSDPNFKWWHRYGGRGIKVCDRWKKFSNFLDDMGRKPSNKLSIERINNDGDYCPENCKWATIFEQSRNKRSNRIYELNGVKMNIVDWGKMSGISYQVLSARINKQGLSFKEAMKKPLYKHTKKRIKK